MGSGASKGRSVTEGKSGASKGRSVTDGKSGASRRKERDRTMNQDN